MRIFAALALTLSVAAPAQSRQGKPVMVAPIPVAPVSSDTPAKPVVVTAPDVVNFEALVKQAGPLLEQAAKGSGSVSVTLSNYNGHFTMLSARTKSGGAELHGKLADFLIVLEGEGTELTGGNIIDRKDQPNGEVRGTRLEGATAHVLHKGDVIHIPAGTPHQAIEAPGQHIVVYVIKVEETQPQAGTGAPK